MWSPFVAISFAVVAALLLLVSDDRWSAIRTACHPLPLAAAAGLAVWIVPNLSTNAVAIPARLTLGEVPALAYISRYLTFIGLEFLVYGVVGIWALRKVPAALAAATAVLLALPLAFGGTANDLMMRGLDLPMVFVLFFCLRALSVGNWSAKITLAAVLVLGAGTAIGEWGAC
jgi:hypothetical protein